MGKRQRVRTQQAARGVIAEPVYQALKIAILTAQNFEHRVEIERSRLTAATAKAMTAAGLDPACSYQLDDVARVARKR